MKPRRKRPEGAKRPGPPSKIDWSAARDEYVTGDHTYDSIAERFGVSPKTVEVHATDRRENAGRTWGEMRADFRDDVSEKFTERAASTLARKRQLLGDRATDVALSALSQLKSRVAAGMMADKDLIGAAKIATTIKVEIGTIDGSPLPIAARLDDLTLDELRRLAAGE